MVLSKECLITLGPPSSLSFQRLPHSNPAPIRDLPPPDHDRVEVAGSRYRLPWVTEGLWPTWQVSRAPTKMARGGSWGGGGQGQWHQIQLSLKDGKETKLRNMVWERLEPSYFSVIGPLLVSRIAWNSSTRQRWKMQPFILSHLAAFQRGAGIRLLTDRLLS